MNLYAYLHNDPLTHLDEHGLWTESYSRGFFSAPDYFKRSMYNLEQFSMGVNRGLINAGFQTGRLLNAITHGIASPFHSFNWQTMHFNFSMGNSYHTINNWLNQKQNSINTVYFSGANQGSWAFHGGHFIGNTWGDFVIGGGIMKGIKSSFNIGRSALSASRKLEIVQIPKLRIGDNPVLTNFWPSNRGFIGEIKRKHLMTGEFFDRYGDASGKFASPLNTPFESRSIPSYMKSRSHIYFEVLKPFEVNSGIVSPAFNQPGLGFQYEFPVSIRVLQKRGIIREIPIPPGG